MSDDMGGRMLDREDLKAQAGRSRRQLREAIGALDGVCAELDLLRQQADELRSDAQQQLTKLEQNLARAERSQDIRAWRRLEPDVGIPMQMEMQVMELKQVVAARDYLVRGRCQVCSKPFLTRKSGRQRQYCSDRCRVRASRR